MAERSKREWLLRERVDHQGKRDKHWKNEKKKKWIKKRNPRAQKSHPNWGACRWTIERNGGATVTLGVN